MTFIAKRDGRTLELTLLPPGARFCTCLRIDPREIASLHTQLAPGGRTHICTLVTKQSEKHRFVVHTDDPDFKMLCAAVASPSGAS